MKTQPWRLEAGTGRAPICAQYAVAVRELRLALGVSQERLAAESGVSLRMVRYIEKRGRVGTPDVLERIARALGFPLSELTFVAEQVTLGSG